MRSFNVTVNGKLYAVDVEEVSGERTVSAAPVQASAPAPAPAAAPTPTAASAPAAPAAPVSGEAIKAPMPGAILRVDVQPGQSVKKDEVLLILEAMKMENEIMAPRDAIIKAVMTTKGSNVSTGDVLVVLE